MERHIALSAKQVASIIDEKKIEKNLDFFARKAL